MVEQGMTCVKYLLFAFNLLFFIFGAVLIGVGAYVQVELSDYLAFFGTANVNSTAILIIVVGALTLVIGFFGCCGAIKENNCMVMTFAGLISIILICEIAGGIAAFMLEADVDKLLNDTMKGTMNESDLASLWDDTQKEFQCCGTDGVDDWGNDVPASCCSKNCDGPESGYVYYDKGCLQALEDFVVKNIVIVAGIAIGLGVVEFLGIVLACCLGRAIRREDQYA